ncbi:MAG TPA: hypothetical protein VFD23_01365 [Clostridia bacterium]|nr:hypothetical protein [Clostridia bacterium]
MYRLKLTTEEISVILHALVDFRNKRLAEGKTVYLLDDLILKLAD